VNLLIFGSRNVDIESTKKRMREYLVAKKPTKIITASDPDGVCRIAQELAKEFCLPLTLHFLDPKRNQGMYHHRSVAATIDCDEAVFFYNGKSKGTANEIEVATKLSKKFEIITVKEVQLSEIEEEIANAKRELNLDDLKIKNIDF